MILWPMEEASRVSIWLLTLFYLHVWNCAHAELIYMLLETNQPNLEWPCAIYYMSYTSLLVL